MSYDVGDAVTLTWQLRDSAGALVNGTVTLTITAPDGTITTPAPSNPSVGNYSHVLALTQAGTWRWRWVATGTATSAEEGLLNATAAPSAVVTLAEIKAQLNIPATQTSHDDELRSYAHAYLPVIEEMIGGPVVPQTVTETHLTDSGTVILRRIPVTAVTTVTDDGTAVASTTYTADLAAGIVYLDGISNSSSRLRGYRRPVTVTYTSGYATVPANIKQALLVLIQINWSHEQQGYRPNYGNDADQPIEQQPTLAHVRTLLMPHLRGPVVA